METRNTKQVSIVTTSTRGSKRTSSRPERAGTSGVRAPEPVAIAERIISAARAHFFAFGFARCTMDELAVELGMSKKTLYQHFPGKEAIMAELIERKAAAMIAGFEAILAEPRISFADRTARFLRHAAVHLGEIDVRFLRDLRRFLPDQFARVEALRGENLPRMWERLLHAGVAARAVRADVDVPFVARVVLLAMQNLLLPENLERFQAQPHEVMGKFFNLIFAGLLTGKGHHDYEKHRASFERALPPR